MARIQTPPSLISQVRGNVLIPDDLNSALWENGVKVLHERAVRCPCEGESSSPETNCNNCMGTGWVFVNPIETKALITSINKNTRYKDWNPDFIGTVALTFMNVNRLSIGDRVTSLERESVHSENVTVRETVHLGVTTYFSFLTYKPKRIDSVFIYANKDVRLGKLASTDFAIDSFNPYVITFKNKPSNGVASVTYEHSLVYHVMDIPHDFRISKEYDENGKRSTTDLPIQAIARKKQYMFSESAKFVGNDIFENSWL